MAHLLPVELGRVVGVDLVEDVADLVPRKLFNVQLAKELGKLVDQEEAFRNAETFFLL
jgi:hypothetical protein